MFKVTTTKNDNSLLNEVIITNESLNLEVSIYPNLGATLKKIAKNGIEIINLRYLKELFEVGLNFNSNFHYINVIKVLNLETVRKNISYTNGLTEWKTSDSRVLKNLETNIEPLMFFL